jgi:hypothetical protein
MMELQTPDKVSEDETSKPNLKRISILSQLRINKPEGPRVCASVACEFWTGS